jgi:hypothetical protein
MVKGNIQPLEIKPEKANRKEYWRAAIRSRKLKEQCSAIAY